jgi:hypothetical protein
MLRVKHLNINQHKGRMRMQLIYRTTKKSNWKILDNNVIKKMNWMLMKQTKI